MSRDETGGAVTTWMIAMAVVATLFTALVVDTSRILAASTAVGDVADAAGRAAATTVDPITGRIEDPAVARREGHAIITSAGMTGTVDPGPRRVATTVETTVDLPLLSIVGVGPRTVTAIRTTVIDSSSR